MTEHIHVWVKIADGTYRCDDWPTCKEMWLSTDFGERAPLQGWAKTSAFPRGQIL